MKCIIAAIRTEDDFNKALESEVEIIFDLSPDLLTIENKIKSAHKANKKLFIHLDLASGIGKDKSGIMYAKQIGADGIISTRVGIIKLAKQLDMLTVQRFFVVDSQSVDTTIEAIKNAKPHMIEIMPGLITKSILKLKQSVSVPIIAGGLIDDETEVNSAFEAGAFAISTGKHELWMM